jgi:NADH-quinone oxidoreductase subunit G
MPKITINNVEIEVEPGLTVLQACEIAGVEIPRFCYHERLAIAGNCRMCLVEMEKSPKPIASCAMPVADNMVIHTNTPMVKKAREGVMEFLLINHPLDCPICDQGGECDLQDQAMAYGKGSSRFHENKRAVTEKYMGPLIKTHMTRCIHCTRCIRFVTEVAGVEELGAVGRGEHMEVTTYVEKALTSELSGNIIDLCPVGALTSKPFAFKARSWELAKTESIDVLDAVGSNIRIDSRGLEVMRILPRLNEEINEEWLADKSRFAYDGLKVQRLDRPMIRIDGKLTAVSFEEAIKYTADKLKSVASNKIGAIVGDLQDAESIFMLKELMQNLQSSNMDCRQDGAKQIASNRASYLFNTTIAGIERADACLLIGTNPRYEAPLVNTRLRKRSLSKAFKIASIGPKADLTYPVEELGNNIKLLEEILQGTHPFAQALGNAEFPMLILGMGALTRTDGEHILSLAQDIAEKYGFIKEGWNGFNVLNKAASRVGALDLGFVPGTNGKDVMSMLEGAESGEMEAIYLLGADEIDTTRLQNSFVIYQGHHGDRGAHAADVILPGAAYTEKNATYVNLEGRVQRTYKAVSPPGQAKEDWVIINLLIKALGLSGSYNDITVVRAEMAKVAPQFASIDQLTPAKWEKVGTKSKLFDVPLVEVIENYYRTDPISRASKTMSECSVLIKKNKKAA